MGGIVVPAVATFSRGSRLRPEAQAFIAQRLKNWEDRAAAQSQRVWRRNAETAVLSFAQQRLWFVDQLEPGQAVYHVHCALRLTGTLHKQHLQAVLNEIVRRHQTLRTVFTMRDGAPIQRINPPSPVPLKIARIARTELQSEMEAEASRPFALGNDLMLRAALYECEPDEHVLQLTLHHIASDAWSLELLLDECLRLYDDFSHGRRSSLPELPMQYSDFAVWQREAMQAAHLQSHLNYWRQKLTGAPDALNLPIETAAPAVPSNRGATCALLLDRALFQSLSRLAQEQNATLFMVLLAGFKVLLHRYSGQEDIVVGSPISRRTETQTERLIGFFLNTLVLRTDLSGNPSVLDALQRVRETALDGYVHQAVPFEKLVEELQPQRDPRRTPFFQVMFTCQEAPKALPTLESLRVERLEFELGVAPFDLTLLARVTERGLLLEFEYKTELFSRETMERMAGHFRTLLEAIAQDPLQHIGTLPLLTAAEQKQLLHEFNRSEQDEPAAHCVHELFEQHAARSPDAIAIKFGAHRLSYRELNERANQLAHFLRASGVGIETRVAICTERSFETIIGVLGILKAGGAYVPIEPDEPLERLALKLKDSGVTMLLTQRVLAPSLPKECPKIIWLDADYAAIARHPRANPGSGVRPENLIYVIYTSGSTGAPKGVMLEHRALVTHSLAFARRFGLGPEDRVLQFAPLSFDVSAEEIFPTLITGGTLVLRPAGLAVAIRDFHPFIEHEKLTILNLPTPYWGQWIAEIEERRLSLPPSLRLVVVGSDSVTAEQFGRWKKIAAPHVRWCNAYGTTEATITATIYEPGPDESPASVPVGRPIANTRVHILDARQQLVPIGVPGEIYIGGGEVARGYLKRPDVERLRFVPDPFSRRPAARLNRTGDLGRWRADGNIEFLGRRDNQVKIRGFRIELGEIESALLQMPWVKEAVVAAREDNPGEKRLVAYFVPTESEPAALIGKLQQALKSKLPSYMMPAAFVPLAELTLLPSGKVDRKALPAPSLSRPELQEEFAPPSDSLEEKLVNIWRQVLGVEQVGVNDNFFNLGGHSLLAVRLFAEIEKLTGWNLPLLSLFQSPTIKQLAEVIRRMQSEKRRSSILPVQPHGTRPPLFLVHGAGGGMLWGYANLSRHLGPDQPVYVFNSRGMDGLDEFATIDEMAAQYVRELREFQPQGPYYLGGYCFGGEVAFEMAQQLTAQGQRVAMLAVINAMPPNAAFDLIRPTPLWVLRFTRNSWYWFRYFCHWTPEQRRTFVGRKARACRKALARLLRLGRDRRGIPEAEDQVDLSLYPAEQQKLWDIHLRASAQYHPRPYPGPITVIRTRFHPFLCSFDPTFGWAEFAQGGVTAKIVPGAHESVLDQAHAAAAAAALDQSLRAARQPHSESSPNPQLHTLGRMALGSVIWLLEFAPAL
jgi:amino acid adenylation domain-containing protein